MSIARQNFARIWAARHDDNVIVFANGHRYGKAERREQVRQIVGIIRRAEGR